MPAHGGWVQGGVGRFGTRVLSLHPAVGGRMDVRIHPLHPGSPGPWLDTSWAEVRGYHSWPGKPGALLGALSPGCGLPLSPAPINRLQELLSAWGRAAVPLLRADCSANERVCEIFNYGFHAWLNYLHMAFTSEKRAPACRASPQHHV